MKHTKLSHILCALTIAVFAVSGAGASLLFNTAKQNAAGAAAPANPVVSGTRIEMWANGFGWQQRTEFYFANSLGSISNGQVVGQGNDDTAVAEMIQTYIRVNGKSIGDILANSGNNAFAVMLNAVGEATSGQYCLSLQLQTSIADDEYARHADVFSFGAVDGKELPTVLPEAGTEQRGDFAITGDANTVTFCSGFSLNGSPALTEDLTLTYNQTQAGGVWMRADLESPKLSGTFGPNFDGGSYQPNGKQSPTWTAFEVNFDRAVSYPGFQIELERQLRSNMPDKVTLNGTSVREINARNTRIPYADTVLPAEATDENSFGDIALNCHANGGGDRGLNFNLFNALFDQNDNALFDLGDTVIEIHDGLVFPNGAMFVSGNASGKATLTYRADGGWLIQSTDAEIKAVGMGGYFLPVDAGSKLFSFKLRFDKAVVAAEVTEAQEQSAVKYYLNEDILVNGKSLKDIRREMKALDGGANLQVHFWGSNLAEAEIYINTASLGLEQIQIFFSGVMSDTYGWTRFAPDNDNVFTVKAGFTAFNGACVKEDITLLYSSSVGDWVVDDPNVLTLKSVGEISGTGTETEAQSFVLTFTRPLEQGSDLSAVRSAISLNGTALSTAGVYPSDRAELTVVNGALKLSFRRYGTPPTGTLLHDSLTASDKLELAADLEIGGRVLNAATTVYYHKADGTWRVYDITVPFDITPKYPAPFVVDPFGTAFSVDMGARVALQNAKGDYYNGYFSAGQSWLTGAQIGPELFKTWSHTLIEQVIANGSHASVRTHVLYDGKTFEQLIAEAVAIDPAFDKDFGIQFHFADNMFNVVFNTEGSRAQIYGDYVDADLAHSLKFLAGFMAPNGGTVAEDIEFFYNPDTGRWDDFSIPEGTFDTPVSLIGVSGPQKNSGSVGFILEFDKDVTVKYAPHFNTSAAWLLGCQPAHYSADELKMYEDYGLIDSVKDKIWIRANDGVAHPLRWFMDQSLPAYADVIVMVHLQAEGDNRKISVLFNDYNNSPEQGDSAFAIKNLADYFTVEVKAGLRTMLACETKTDAKFSYDPSRKTWVEGEPDISDVPELPEVHKKSNIAPLKFTSEQERIVDLTKYFTVAENKQAGRTRTVILLDGVKIDNPKETKLSNLTKTYTVKIVVSSTAEPAAFLDVTSEFLLETVKYVYTEPYDYQSADRSDNTLKLVEVSINGVDKYYLITEADTYIKIESGDTVVLKRVLSASSRASIRKIEPASYPGTLRVQVKNTAGESKDYTIVFTTSQTQKTGCGAVGAPFEAVPPMAAAGLILTAVLCIASTKSKTLRRNAV